MLWLASELTHMLLFLRTLQNAGDLTVSGISVYPTDASLAVSWKHVTTDTSTRNGLSSLTPAEAE